MPPLQPFCHSASKCASRETTVQFTLQLCATRVIANAAATTAKLVQDERSVFASACWLIGCILRFLIECKTLKNHTAAADHGLTMLTCFC